MRLFRRKVENRASYTDLAISQILANAEGPDLRPETTAAVEIAASALSRALATAQVTPQTPETRALTPRVLWDIGRRLVVQGESLHVIRVSEGPRPRVTLCAAATGWSIIGNADESTWRYLVSLAAPTDQRPENVPSSTVIHCRYTVDEAQPHIGISPFGVASASSKLTAALESQLGNEAAGPHGHLIPAPTGGIPEPDSDSDDDPVNALAKVIARLKGRSMILEGMQGSWGEGGQSRADWQPRRIGRTLPKQLSNCAAML